MKLLHLTIATLGICAAAFAIAQPRREEGDPISEADSQDASLLDQIKNSIDDMTTTATQATNDDEVQGNRRAFLDMIAYSEGTLSAGDNGYRMMFGGTLGNDLSDHPRKLFSFTNKRGEVLKTSAAGRYQFLARTWDGLVAKLGLPDFGADSQDAAALELVRQCGALNDVDAGRVDTAIKKCSRIWASFPNAGYAQPERKLSTLTTAYANAGGIIDTASA